MIDYKDPNIVYFVGESNLTTNCVTGQHHPFLAIGLLIDTRTSEILDAYVSLVSPQGSKFVREQFIGRRLLEDYDLIIESLQRYRAIARKSVIVATKAVYNTYLQYLSEHSE